MLSVAVFVAAAMLTALDAQPTQRLPQMPDWRSEFMKNPPRSTLTSEWTCERGGRNSRATITIEDVGVRIRNSVFKTKLVDLSTEGRNAGPELRKRIGAALAQLNNITVFQGQCRDKSPGLFITGFSFDGKRYSKREFRFDLR